MMAIDVYHRIAEGAIVSIDESITLDHYQREKGRFKVLSDLGHEVRVFLERGHPLKVGEILLSSCGKHLKVIAAAESVITASASDWEIFCRACYHLGNRHVKVQLGELWLRITPDHVLEDMLSRLGLSIKNELSPFEPESGAYFVQSHHTGHDH